MKHFGDITKLNGRDLPIVDIITGGSPCQDLSIAGLRKGLSGERSGLFMEQIRIIKEMRDYDRELHPNEPIRPRYMVWENVCGAFSSNKGEDFRAVLEETAKVVDKDAVIPEPPKGKWTPSGCIVGDGWSIAWRVHDAQFWGVPQRRKRISLVADFGGASAPEILFERKSVSGNTSESGEKRQGITTDTQRDINKTEPMCVQRRFSSVNTFENGITPTLEAGAGEGGNNMPMICESPTLIIENHPNDSRVKINEDNVFQTLSGRMGTGGGNVPMVMEEPVCIGNGQLHDDLSPSIGVSKTLNCMDDPMKVIAYGLDRASFNQGQNAKYDFSIEEEKIATQVSRGPGAVCTSIVRRLTPMECERLQGYPDGWTDIGDWVDSKGKKHKGDADAPRYKALGNSIALPYWDWLAERITSQYDRPTTMGSLFDGIGGFPLCFSRHNCEPVWASEIEEFPIAVTKLRFPEKVGDSDE